MEEMGHFLCQHLIQSFSLKETTPPCHEIIHGLIRFKPRVLRVLIFISQRMLFIYGSYVNNGISRILLIFTLNFPEITLVWKSNLFLCNYVGSNSGSTEFRVRRNIVKKQLRIALLFTQKVEKHCYRIIIIIIFRVSITLRFIVISIQSCKSA